MKLIHEVCTVNGCGRKHKARGYCASHYIQWFRVGHIITETLNTRVAEKPPCCTVEGCDKPVKGKGLCAMHWARNSRHGHLRKPDRIKPRVVCSVPGCEDWSYAKTMCHAHYIRVLRLVRRYGLLWDKALVHALSAPKVCEICGKEPSVRHGVSLKVKSLCVDHNHTTGKIRGWLCDECNSGIGLLQDSPEVLEKAAAYLRRWSE